MQTTMKITRDTKERLDSLDLAGKGKTYDMIINDLITSYQKTKKNYEKNVKEWKQAMETYKKQTKEYENEMKTRKESREKYDKELKTYSQELKAYNKEKEKWNKLLKWAKSKGFKE